MRTREEVVEIMYFANAEDKKEAAILQLIARLGNLTSQDFGLTVKLLTGTIITDRLEGMKQLWAKKDEWQSWLGTYAKFEDAPDQRFRIFVDAVVRANKRVMDAVNK